MDCGHGGQEVVLWREAALQGGHAVIALQDGEQVVAASREVEKREGCQLRTESSTGLHSFYMGSSSRNRY
eukprot:1151862-Pelagomonas_calceolata.AAC.2